VANPRQSEGGVGDDGMSISGSLKQRQRCMHHRRHHVEKEDVDAENRKQGEGDVMWGNDDRSRRLLLARRKQTTRERIDSQRSSIPMHPAVQSAQLSDGRR